jgi:DNA-damage-inducible protein D
MADQFDHIKLALDAKMRITPRGLPYWHGRDLMEILSYARWEDFTEVVEKAIQACDNSGKFSSNHFRYVPEMIEAGKGAKKSRENLILSKYACYLISMNGSSSKPEVATAQTYFAVQTHRLEVEEALTDQQRRLLLRNRVKDAHKKLFSAAKESGVKRYPIFQDAGYKGLYGGRGRDEVKSLKGIPAADDLLDCIDREELATHEFRAT